MTAILFSNADGPRVFALPPGVDFPAELVRGLQQRLQGQPPEAMAEVVVFVNTARMARRLQAMFDAGGASFLPRLRLVTDLGVEAAALDLPQAVPGLRRRLEVATLVGRLLDSTPDLAPRAALFDLADSLATLMEEMQGEGVTPDDLSRLDVSQHSGHWERSLAFLGIVSRYFDSSGEDAPDAEGLRRRTVLALAERWSLNPPQHPILLAGSTGSRGTTALFMQAVARLPQGAVVLPGYDFDMPDAAWTALDYALAGEDHPQYRFRKLAHDIGLAMEAIRPWAETAPPDPARNRLMSLALRPAPVTDQWLAEGPHLGDLSTATAAMTLIEASSPRAEASAIALALRQAAEEGISAALVSPDRGLTRQVTAALERWGIRIDDSAGAPLHQSAPGRFLRQVAELMVRAPTGDTLLALLKHPLTASTYGSRGRHLLFTRELELWMRRKGIAWADPVALGRWAKEKADGREDWARWLADRLAEAAAWQSGNLSLSACIETHLRLSEAIAAGSGAKGNGELWLEAAGIEALAAMTALRAEAPHGGDMASRDYADLLHAVLQRGEVREAPLGYPGLTIWGTLEARVQGADLLILAGLNDGIWPKAPAPDPWLNRRLRLDAGLLLPERQVGLSAHDFQQAVLAPRVILSRAKRDAEAETVPSRWLNRLTNLLDGLPDQKGPLALEAMRERGDELLKAAERLDKPRGDVPAAPRPAPRPPVEHRPKELPVTQIRTLIRDPYAVYARYILRLRPLRPLHPEPDAALRGTAIHRMVERFIGAVDPVIDPKQRFLGIVDEVLADAVPWPATRILWRVRLEKLIDSFLAREAERAAKGCPVLLEESGRITLPLQGFTLTARPDRIDRLEDGRVHIYDYKTGRVPSVKEQATFDKQLLLEAAMALRGAFSAVGSADVEGVTYIGLGSDPKDVALKLDANQIAETWAEFERLIASYGSRARGYPSRRAMFEEQQKGDYDQLARFGEWDMADDPKPEDVG